MKAIVALSVFALAGCAGSPEYAASQSNWDVCRLTMGGPHARYAEAEAVRRGLDCRPYYGAIQGQMANQNAAVQGYLRSMQPTPQPTTNCTSYRAGNTIQTDCR
mgnify:CR=1 FL=1